MDVAVEEQDVHTAPMVEGLRWTQHLAAILATLGAMSVGAVDGWTANALPLLRSGDLASADEISWLSSLVALGALFGSLPAGMMADKWGRKMMLLLMTIPFSASWIIIIFAGTSIPSLYASRFVSGFAMGIVSVVTPLYNEEISEVAVRGALGVYQNLMVAVGITFAYVVGALVPYVWMSIVPCFIPITMLCTFVWVPESPVYLLSRGRVEQAQAALHWLRGSTCDIKPEMARIHEMLDEAKSRKKKQPFYKQIQEMFQNVSYVNSKALAIVFALMTLRQLTGINAIVFYTVEIFDGSSNILPSKSSTIVIGAVEVLATYVSSLLVDKTGRRVLLIFSGLGTAVCHTVLALYFYFLGNGYDLSHYNFIPLISLAFFIIIFSAGFGPLPWFMMAELIPTEEKAWATGVSGSINWFFMFIIIKMFSVMVSQLGADLTFAIFAINCVLASLFVAAFVPETNGKTLNEIRQELRGH